MTTVTITDEATRRAVEAALWHQVQDASGADAEPGELPEAFDELTDAAEGWPWRDGAFPDSDRGLALLDTIVANVVRSRQAVMIVRSAQIGATIDLPVDQARFAEALVDVVKSIESFGVGNWVDGGIMAQPPEIRDTMIAIRDAASMLIADMHVEAVA